MADPRVIVVMTSYNDAALIEQAVTSVARQRGIERVLEFALVDDASRDQTVERALGAWASDVPFRALPAPVNLGPWPNLNRALHYAAERADWALLLHADDYAADGWVSETIGRIDRCPDDVATISCSWHVVENGKHTAGENASDEYRRIDGGDATVASTLQRGCWWKLSGAAIRLRAFEQIGDFVSDYYQCGDWEWLMRAQRKGWAVEYIPRALVNYRQHAASMSSRSMKEDIEIADSIGMLDLHGGLLSRSQRARFLGRRGYYLSRRFARALTRGDAHRMGVTLRSAATLLRAFQRHLL